MVKYCWLLLALLLPLNAAFAIGEQYGRITGVVYAPDGAEIAGAKLTLTSPNLLGGARNLISAEDGSFTFNNLPPGKYELIITNQLLQTYKKTGIVVRVGKTSSTSIYFALDSATDELGVLLSPSTQPATPIDTRELTQGGDFLVLLCDVPEGRSYEDLTSFLERNRLRYIVDGDPRTFTPCCNCCSPECWEDVAPSKICPTVGDTSSKFIGSQFVQNLPKEGQSLQAFVLEFPRTEVKNSALRMNGQPISVIENGQRALPSMAKQARY